MGTRIKLDDREVLKELSAKIQLTKDKSVWQIRFWINDGQDFCYNLTERIENAYYCEDIGLLQIRLVNRNGVFNLRSEYTYYKTSNCIDDNWYVVELGNGNEIEIELL